MKNLNKSTDAVWKHLFPSVIFEIYAKSIAHGVIEYFMERIFVAKRNKKNK